MSSEGIILVADHSVDESIERKLKVGVSGVLKRVDPGRNDLATPWLTGTWSNNVSSSVTYTGLQKAKQKAKSYQPKFSGKAGPAPGGGGAGKPQDYEWKVDGQYELVDIDVRVRDWKQNTNMQWVEDWKKNNSCCWRPSSI